LTQDDTGSRDELAEDEVPDVDVTISVRANELRFEAAPKVNVRFAGEPAIRYSTRTQRENLPEEVVPGVTYRDARVLWDARARIIHPTDPPRPGD
jgi:hypothetical protein